MQLAQNSQSQQSVAAPLSDFVSNVWHSQRNVDRSIARARAGRQSSMARMRARGNQGRKSTSNELILGRVGKRSAATALPYKQLSDMLFPRMAERLEDRGFLVTGGVIRSFPGVQNLDTASYFNLQQLQGWYAKSVDGTNISTLSTVASTTAFDWVFDYLGGKATYTLTNTGSHVAQVDMWQVQSKRYQNISPLSRWQTDLTEDNTLFNVVAPINSEATSATIGYRPGVGVVSGFRDYYKITSKKRYIIEPGATVRHTVVFPAFRITGKQLNTVISAGVVAAINPKTQVTMCFVQGVGLVCDSADTDVNVGSAIIVTTREQKHMYRACPTHKGYQTYNLSTLPTAFAAEQEINPETEALDAGFIATD